MVCLVSLSHKKKDSSPVVDVHPHHPHPTSLSSLALVAETWISSTRRFLTVHSPPPAPSIPQFTDTRLPFIPTIQTPNTRGPFVRDAYWPSPGRPSPSPFLGIPSPTNTVEDFLVHRGPRTAQVSFHRPYPYSLGPLPRNGVPAATYQHHEAVIPYSQHFAPVRVDFSLVSKEKKQPPRPCNAFMLFRSDFLKRKFISRDQETRQHRISIIAAKCWHRLSKEEKKKWFLEAEQEKKRHALKYAGYRFQPRARTTTRREPKLAPPPEEFESLCRLADMAYQEIINDDLVRENATSPSTTSTSVSASPTPPPTTQIDMTELPFLECYGGQIARLKFSSSAAAANHSVRSAQLPYMAAGVDAIRNTTMSRGTRCLSSPGDGIQVASNHFVGTAAHPLCTFSSQGISQGPVPPLLQAHSTTDPFAIFNSGARLPHGVPRAPFPASLAQDSLGNA
ncbi:hypothetical protein EDB84DRAFT_1556407 [Lactarius hengduanensis]|nr:hypothetical protein EDB84DRAFT_1556407 [Lactarius hengduanensis]